MRVARLLPVFFLMNFAACIKITRSSDSVPGSTSYQEVKDPLARESNLAVKEINLSTAGGATIRISWGLAVREYAGNITTSSYRLSRFRVEVTGVESHKRELKVILVNKLKSQNLHTGAWQPETSKQYQISLIRTAESYSGSLESDGIVVDSATAGSGSPVNSLQLPILMEHGQQLHWKSTGQELQLLIDGVAQTFSGRDNKTISEFHLEE